MRNRVSLIVFLCLSTSILSAQTVYPSENDVDIYWQPNTQIDFSDYQSPNIEECIKFNEEYGLTMSSHIGFRGVVDIPKKKRKYDKFYIAPVFNKNCSCILSEDSLSLQVDLLLFDIAEVCARRARKELLDLRAERNSDNTYTMFFTTVKNKWDEEMRAFFSSVITDILIEKKDSSYMNWREAVDDALLQTIKYATQPEDCYRFIKNEPIEKDYIVPETIMGDWRNNKEEQE